MPINEVYGECVATDKLDSNEKNIGATTIQVNPNATLRTVSSTQTETPRHVFAAADCSEDLGMSTSISSIISKSSNSSASTSHSPITPSESETSLIAEHGVVTKNAANDLSFTVNESYN